MSLSYYSCFNCVKQLSIQDLEFGFLYSADCHHCICQFSIFYTVDCSLVPSICISVYIRFIYRLFRSVATSITGYYRRSKPINTTYVYLVRCVLVTSTAWCIVLIYRKHGCFNNNVQSIVSIATMQ